MGKVNMDEHSELAPAAADAGDGRRVRVVQLAGLSLGHAVNDAFVNVVAPLWPQIQQAFGLNNAAVGSITFWWGLTMNFGQPIYGYLTDRWQPRRLVVAATLLSTVFFGGLGYAHSLPLLMVCLVLGGVGAAVYHPRAGALAVAVSGGRRALGMGIFGAGGAFGYALGYLCSPYLYHLAGSMKGLAYAMPVGLAGAVMLLLVDAEARVPRAADADFSFRRDVAPRLGKLMPLFVVMVLRSATVVAFATFIPIMLAAHGRELIAGGKAGFFFVAGGAVGGLIGGHVSDRLGRRGITIVTLAAGPALLWLTLRTAAYPGLGAFFAMLFVTGLIVRAAEPVNTTHTQELLPGGASLAASLGMGCAWGVAGLIAPLVGRLGDVYGVDYALQCVIWVPGLAAAAALFIPRGQTHRGTA
jgi:MFS transporter, FSR family, fosmidomycin resistance protein